MPRWAVRAGPFLAAGGGCQGISPRLRAVTPRRARASPEDVRIRDRRSGGGERDTGFSMHAPWGVKVVGRRHSPPNPKGTLWMGR